MQSETQKALYHKYLKKYANHFTPQQIEDLESMKRSTDSFYKKLNMQHDETEDKIDELNTDEPHSSNPKMVANSSENHTELKQNPKTEPADCSSSSKQLNTSQLGQNSNIKKVIKPSTPTFHAQSSLNFLKHRKKQLIMNQAMGLTYDNLQLQRKSRSKSRQQRSVNKIQHHKNKSDFIDNRLNAHINNLDSMKKSSFTKSASRIQRVRSFSQLSKVQSILRSVDKNSPTQNQRSFLQRSQAANKSRQNRTKSLTNSLNSSRAKSFQSEASDYNKSKSSRTLILNSIAQKLSESKFLKNIEVQKQKKTKKETQYKQNLMEKRLKNLEMILFEIQKQENKKRTISNNFSEPKLPQQNSIEFIYKIKKQIDILSHQLNQLQKCPIKQSISPIKKDTFLKSPQSLKNPMIQNTIQFNPQNIQVSKSEHRINNHFQSSGLLISKPISNPLLQAPKHSQPKITFKYNNLQKPTNHAFIQPSVGNYQHHSISNEKYKKQLIYNNKPPLNGITNNIQPKMFYPSQNTQQNTSLSYQNNPFSVLSNYPSNKGYYSNLMSPQIQQNPNQLAYNSNKSISLKNKHAIEAKIHSPVKINGFNFMSTQNRPYFN